jgi:TPR repeat protein
VRCRHCGTENPGIHRFCGMCGRPLEDEARLVQEGADEPSSKGESSAPALEGVPHPTPMEPPTPAPAYTGGLFTMGGANAPSSNLDYLLEDDEPRSRKGLLLLGVVAVALVLGLGWLRFRQNGIPGLRDSSAKTAPPLTAAPADSTTTTAPPATAASPDSTTAIAPGNPAPSISTTPSASGGSNQTSGTTPLPPFAPPSSPPPAATDPNAAAQGATNSASPPGDAGATSSATSSPAAEPAPVSLPDHGGSSNPPADPPTATVVAPAATPDVPAPVKPKKVVKPTPAKPEDTVALGEKYLYGRGAPQNCDKGLQYVKPAAQQSNTKAMITMGALYATGHCLSRDLPTAYRYFALALRQDPENSALKQNAEMVWGQMTQSERQLAIRMTQ